jgi:hypothetical protein
MGLGFRGRNKNNKKEESTSLKDPTRSGKWKHCLHSETGKVYFYHTKTKETTWTKPDSFQVYKVVTDPSSGRPYFYNRITRQTTWEKPSDFEEWKTAQDKSSGNTYYYNILTKETSWSDPRMKTKETQKVEDRPANNSVESQAIDPILPEALSHFISFMDPYKYEEEFSSEHEGSDLTTGSTVTPGNELRRKDHKQDVDSQSDTFFIPVPKSKFSVSYKNNDWNDEVQESSTDRGNMSKAHRIPVQVSFDENELNRKRFDDRKPYPNSKSLSVSEYSDLIEYKNPNQQRLAKLLSVYLPMNKDVADNLMKCCKSKEDPVLQAIDQIIQDSPFDEISLGVYRYAMAYIESNGERKYLTTLPKEGSAYSMKQPILSVLSTRTEQTARVQNKTSKVPLQSSTIGNGPWLQSIPDEIPTTDVDSREPDPVVMESSQPVTPSEASSTYPDEHNESNLNDVSKEVATTSNSDFETPQKQNPLSCTYASNMDEDTTPYSMDPTEESVSDLSDSFSPLYGKRSVREKNRIEKLKNTASASPVEGLEKLSVSSPYLGTP